VRPRLQQGQLVNQIGQGSGFPPFAAGSLALAVLAVEQFLQPLVERRREAERRPVLRQRHLHEN
jgi:hypothetical protein